MPKYITAGIDSSSDNSEFNHYISSIYKYRVRYQSLSKVFQED